jgi:hypothetical protein
MARSRVTTAVAVTSTMIALAASAAALHEGGRAAPRAAPAVAPDAEAPPARAQPPRAQPPRAQPPRAQPPNAQPPPLAPPPDPPPSDEEAPPGVVVGVVVGADGKPTSACVHLSAGEDGGGYVLAGEDGVFRLEAPPGEYTLWAHAEGAESDEIEPVTLASREQLIGFEVALHAERKESSEPDEAPDEAPDVE